MPASSGTAVLVGPRRADRPAISYSMVTMRVDRDAAEQPADGRRLV